MNAYRLTGDLCHLASKAILILTIHLRSSAEGISLLTQMLYALVFLTRYTDIFSPDASTYVTIFKWTYILTSFYIIYVMLRVFKRSREEEKEWRVAAVVLAISFVLAPVCWGLKEVIWRQTKRGDWVTQIPWTFSIILESLAVLPQISLLRYTAIPTAITSYYLLALGVYRALYIPNWIVRYNDPGDNFFEPWAVIFGVLQTILYIEFAWIYWRRQRVKIRDNGAILDGEDFISGGLILRWIGKIGGKSGERSTGGGWRGRGAGGSGGISVSADEEADLVGGEFGDSDEEDEDEGLESESGSEAAVVR
ncbi:ER lumen protein retaining receptor-domain-containing protein [Tuber brumale]|nr:ER lumen protein retaining receptor-domain-containing protein [Tuber brumale]